MSAILKTDFQKSKVSKLHKKDPILQVPTTFFLKQGETRTSSGPIPHPLNLRVYFTLLDMHTDFLTFGVKNTVLKYGGS